MKPYQWLAWLATVSLIASAFLASINLYPYYIYGFLISNSMWILIGVLWKERSLVVMNAGLTLIYIIGLILK
jgi:hypothetical protein